MNKSLRLKLTILFMAIISGIVVCSTAFFTLFLSDYYMIGKQNTLLETFKEIDYVYSENESVKQSQNSIRNNEIDLYNILGSDFRNNLENISEGRNVSIVIFRTSYRTNIFSFEKELVATPIYSSMGQFSSSEQVNMFNDYKSGQEGADTVKEGKTFIFLTQN